MSVVRVHSISQGLGGLAVQVETQLGLETEDIERAAFTDLNKLI